MKQEQDIRIYDQIKGTKLARYLK